MKILSFCHYTKVLWGSPKKVNQIKRPNIQNYLQNYKHKKPHGKQDILALGFKTNRSGRFYGEISHICLGLIKYHMTVFL